MNLQRTLKALGGIGGVVGPMDYGDIWGFESPVLIFYKLRL